MIHTALWSKNTYNSHQGAHPARILQVDDAPYERDYLWLVQVRAFSLQPSRIVHDMDRLFLLIFYSLRQQISHKELGKVYFIGLHNTSSAVHLCLFQCLHFLQRIYNPWSRKMTMEWSKHQIIFYYLVIEMEHAWKDDAGEKIFRISIQSLYSFLLQRLKNP
jgi:hypothetical protein